MMPALSALESDALTELVNVAVSKAAVTLGRMIDSEVSLTVPKVTVVGRDHVAAAIAIPGTDRLVAVGEAFNGPFSGSAVLIFPVANSLELVRAILPHVDDLEEIIEMEQEALGEIGNIILNSCLSTVANMLDHKINTSLPRIYYGEAVDIVSLSEGKDAEAGPVMIFHVDFVVKERGLQGFIMIIMSVSSFLAFRDSIVKLVKSYSETG